MTKAELIEKVATETEMTKAGATRAVNAVFDIISESLKNKESITINNFGTFKTTEQKERNGVNPSNGEKIVIPAKTAPKFVFAKAIKEAVK